MDYPESTILAASRKGYKDVEKYLAYRKREKDKLKAKRAVSESSVIEGKYILGGQNVTSIVSRNLLRNYGITLDQYDEMFEKQEGVCKICKKPETSTIKGAVKRLAVDHCHSTGRIRGLLCNNCNTAIGLFKENKNFMLNAIQYLEER